MIKVNIFDNLTVIRSLVPDADENVRIAWAQEHEKNCGYCVFKTNGELLLTVDKDGCFELLIRAALNSLDLAGVKRAFSSNIEMKNELIKLGFKENNGCAEVDIKAFFKPCCH